MNWVEENGAEQLLPGVHLTQEQLFYLNFAQVRLFTYLLTRMRTASSLRKAEFSFLCVSKPILACLEHANAYNFSKDIQVEMAHEN